jgi:hypothetical protein
MSEKNKISLIKLDRTESEAQAEIKEIRDLLFNRTTKRVAGQFSIKNTREKERR